MATISITTPSDGTTAEAADISTPLNTIVNEINGNLDNSNIATAAAIAGTKLATDSVTDTQLDYPRWWQEIGRTTLGSAGDTITVSSIPARKYLRVLFSLRSTGGTNNCGLTFNNVGTSTYTYSIQDFAGGAYTTGTAQTTIPLETGSVGSGEYEFGYIDISNSASFIKLAIIEATYAAAAGYQVPSKTWGQWNNTSSQITRIDITNNGTGDFAIGSEVVVLGHD